MSYDTVATISQVTSMLMFIALFIAVLVYVFWPGNRQRFDAIQKRALGLENGGTNQTTRKGARD
ncbi:MAG: cbb3-type cytochrome c oxidase subunit 3 [Pseudomonadota bacterium]